MWMQQQFLIKNMQLIINLKKFWYYSSAFESECALSKFRFMVVNARGVLLFISNLIRGKGNFSASKTGAGGRPVGAVAMSPSPSIEDRARPLPSERHLL